MVDIRCPNCRRKVAVAGLKEGRFRVRCKGIQISLTFRFAGIAKRGQDRNPGYPFITG